MAIPRPLGPLNQLLAQLPDVWDYLDSAVVSNQLIDATLAPYNVLNDGTAQSTAALQDAIDDARDSAGVYIGVYLPPGNYKFNSGSLTLYEGLNLVGSWRATFAHTWIFDGSGQPDATDGKGTTIQVDVGSGVSTGAFITVHANASVKGITFYYPSQSRTAATPTTYPPTIFLGESSSQTHFDQCVESCQFLGHWLAIKCRYGGRYMIRNVRGYGVHGIDIDKSYDTSYFENVKWNAYFYSSFASTPPADNFYKYVNQNGTGIKAGRVDNLTILNPYILGVRHAIETVTTSAEGSLPGGSAWMTVIGGGAESCIAGAVLANSQAGGLGIAFNNYRVSATHNSTGAADGYGIVTSSTFDGTLNITNCDFGGQGSGPNSQEFNILLAGGGQVSVSGCRFYNASTNNIRVDCPSGNVGNVTLASNTFNTSTSNAVNITGHAKVNSAGNTFVQKNRADAIVTSGAGGFVPTSNGDRFLDLAGNFGPVGVNGTQVFSTGEVSHPKNVEFANAGVNTQGGVQIQGIGNGANQGWGTVAINATFDRVGSAWNRTNTGTDAWLIIAESNNTNTGPLLVRRAASGSNPITWTDYLIIGPSGGIRFDRGTATATAGAATLNKVSGKITSESLTTAAGADYTLTLTNSLIAADSLVFVSVENGSNTTEGLSVQRVTPGSSSAVILVRNTHASAAWNGTIKLSFVVF